jgi:hypothetical protein
LQTSSGGDDEYTKMLIRQELDVKMKDIEE